MCFKLRARFLQNGGGLHVERLAMSDGSLLSENVAKEVRGRAAACGERVGPSIGAAAEPSD